MTETATETAHDLKVTDRRVTHLLWLTLAVAVVLITTMVLLIPATFAARNNADQVARGNDLAACRSSFRAEVDLANSLGFTIILEGLALLAADDREALGDLAGQVPTIREHIVEATLEYNSAVERSQDDPDGFLRDCRD